MVRWVSLTTSMTTAASLLSPPLSPPPQVAISRPANAFPTAADRYFTSVEPVSSSSVCAQVWASNTSTFPCPKQPTYRRPLRHSIGRGDGQLSVRAARPAATSHTVTLSASSWANSRKRPSSVTAIVWTGSATANGRNAPVPPAATGSVVGVVVAFAGRFARASPATTSTAPRATATPDRHHRP
jgi:hypothetical protein